MRSRAREYIRRHHWGMLATFLVLSSGTAYALDGSNTVFSDDIVNGEVRTQDIRTGHVRADDIAADAVRASEVANESLTKDDVLNNSINGVDIEDGTLGSADVANGQLVDADMAPNSLTGTAINESTVGQVPAATLGGLGRSANGVNCDPDSFAFGTCVDVTLNLPVQTRVLLIGAAVGRDEGGLGHAAGQCRLASGAPGTGTTTVIPGTLVLVDTNGRRGAATTTAVTSPLGPGSVLFGLDCNESFDNIIYDINNVLSAVALSPS